MNGERPEIRIYRGKVRLSGEAIGRVTAVADAWGIDPAEAFNKLIDRGYELWEAQRHEKNASDAPIG